MVVTKAANEITSLDAGMTAMLYAERERPGTSEFIRWPQNDECP